MSHVRPRGTAPLLALVLLGGAGCAASRPAEAPPAARETHPDVGAGGEETCLSCHAGATPQVAQAWRDGRHGLALVKCFVCHGSTGADFRPRPAPGLCAGCHAGEVRSVATPGGGARDCFACHPAHALLPAKGRSPHGRMEGGQP